MVTSRVTRYFFSSCLLGISLILTGCMLIGEENTSPPEKDTEIMQETTVPVEKEGGASTATAPVEQEEDSPVAETAVPPQATATAFPTGEPEQPSILTGIGLMGASTLDEYHGSENRGREYVDTTFNMVELLAMHRGFNFGEWGEWGEPRRIGYEYNWAKTGATSRTLIEQGQHTGLAEQVANGDVTFVFMLVGNNDFGPHTRYYREIYEGQINDAQLEQKIEQAIADVTLATDTVLSAGVEGMAIVLLFSWESQPRVLERYPLVERRQRVENAIAAVNDGIRAMAEERGVIVLDSEDIADRLAPRIDENGFLDVGGEMIDFVNRGYDPYHARLNDRSGHMGTVLSGLMANFYFIETLNTHFGTEIRPFSEEEILTFAGIRNQN